MRTCRLFALALVLAACSGVRPRPAAEESSPADGRLPASARPLSYSLALEVDPRLPRFKGFARIELELAKPSTMLLLHARDIEVHRARLTPEGGRPLVAQAMARKDARALFAEELLVTWEIPATGKARLELEYEAPFAADLAGLYRVEHGGEWYAFTQFEATDARRAFPCFDEPGFKAPFDVELVVPKEMVAVANSVEQSRQERGDKVAIRFARTPPLPTYLVAFGVGPLEVLEGPKTPVPIRLLAPRGLARLGGQALADTAELVRRLAEYFGPFPFEKLDLLAIPDFQAGAMENAGLITGRAESLLVDPQRSTASARRDVTLTLAHEIAHQWFGDLVTMAWWDDLWLNEGFASFMERKVVDAWKPEFHALREGLLYRFHAMDEDGLPSSHPIRAPVSSSSEAEESFDSITYSKGSALLRMLEAYLGEETFRDGLRAYLTAHAWGNATSGDLLSALEAGSGKPVRAIAASFLDRPGVPQVRFERGKMLKSLPPVLTFNLGQLPWRPMGSGESADRLWTIPLCPKASVGEPGCTVLSEKKGSISWRGQVPRWVYPNGSEAGYLRFSLPEEEWLALAEGREALSVDERAGLLSNLWAQVRAGEAEPALLLKVLPSFDEETDRDLVDLAVRILESFDRSLVEPKDREVFAKYVRSRLSKRAAALGLEHKPGEPEDATLMRASVLAAAVDLGGEQEWSKKADAVAAAWLKDPTSVDPETAELAVPLASRGAGLARFEQLAAALGRPGTPAERLILLAALGSLSDPAALRRALELGLTDQIRPSELEADLMRPAMKHRESRALLLAWIEERWPQLRQKLPGPLSLGLSSPVAYLCNSSEIEQADAFFAPRMKEVPGAHRPLVQALELARTCAALRERYAEKAGQALGR